MIIAGLIALTLLSKQNAGVGQPTSKVGQLQAYTGPKKRVAVPGFTSKVDSISVASTMPSGQFGSTVVPIDATGPMGIGEGMADMLNTALVDSKRFIVLERKDLKDLADETGTASADAPPTVILTNGGATNGTTPPPPFETSTYIKNAKLLGAQLMIRGSLTELSYSKTTSSVGNDLIGLDKATFVATCAVDLKVIEVETGRILDSVRAEGKSESRATSSGVSFAGIHLGEQKFQANPLVKAIRQAIESGVKTICTRLDILPWEARVASTSLKDGTRLLYLNFGSESGLKDGTALEIFRPGATVVDPQTHLIIGREDDTVIGKCTIRNATKTMTIALCPEAVVANVGDGVRLPSHSYL